MGDHGLDATLADIDVEALHQKYMAERDKRLRPTGDDQYRHVDDDEQLAAFAADPHADPAFQRAAIVEEIDVLIVGGGLSGLVTAASLHDQNIDSIRIIEKAADFGGVWYWNRYPGAACDVESYIYLPLLEETGYIPTQKYVNTREILEHCQRIGKHYDLYRHGVFQTSVTQLDWNASTSRWTVKTDRGDRFEARYICLGTGAFSVPKLPGIAGIKSFKGEMFHTARWNYEYTKGNHLGGLTGLKDKRVAVIGTGASAIQSIPHLGEWAKELYIFQRTPVSIDERGNRPTDPEWVKSLKPGWQRERMKQFDAITTGIPQDVDEIDDGWTRSCRELFLLPQTNPPLTDPEEIGRVLQRADFAKMESLRQKIDREVKDPATAAALKPYFNLLCKRPGFHDSYLETFNRPNVHLVDTKGQGVERITENSVVVDGEEYPVDCIIFATGFEAAAPTYQSGRFTVRGVDGLSLQDKWEKGVRTLHGMMSHGFPNMFVIMSFQQHAAGFNVPSAIMPQSEHISALIAKFQKEHVISAEPTQQAEDAWVGQVKSRARDYSRFAQECTPGYYNHEGGGESIFGQLYGGGPFEFIDIIKHWREAEVSRDLTLKYEQAVQYEEGFAPGE